MANEELKPCPFCGGKEIVMELREKGVGDKYVKCLSCVTFGPSGKTGEEAAQLWNRRTPAPLKRWTAMDGTPPDGEYCIKIKKVDKEIILSEGPQTNLSQSVSVFLDINGGVLYSPIEAEGGAE